MSAVLSVRPAGELVSEACSGLLVALTSSIFEDWLPAVCEIVPVDLKAAFRDLVCGFFFPMTCPEVFPGLCQLLTRPEMTADRPESEDLVSVVIQLVIKWPPVTDDDVLVMSMSDR